MIYFNQLVVLICSVLFHSSVESNHREVEKEEEKEDIVIRIYRYIQITYFKKLIILLPLPLNYRCPFASHFS